MNEQDIIARAQRNQTALTKGTRPPSKTSRMCRLKDGSLAEQVIYDSSVDPHYMSIRKSLGITQKVFAGLLGITENSYALIERGERAASSSVKKLVLIAAKHPGLLHEVA